MRADKVIKQSRLEGKTLMRKIFFRLTLCAMLFALGSSVEAQQPKKVHRIGYLSNSDPASESARSEAIRLSLHEHGHIEGQNIATEYRYTEIGSLSLRPSWCVSRLLSSW